MPLVPGEDLGVLGNGGVIGPDDGKLEDVGDGQGRQPDRSGRRRLDMGDLLFVAVVEHLQKGRIVDLLLRIFGQFIGSDGLEIAHARRSALARRRRR